MGVCVFKQDPSLRELQLLSPKEPPAVHVREEEDLTSYSVIDENHFCQLLKLERNDEYCRTSGLEITSAKAGQLFYQDGTYTEVLWISLPSMGFEYAFLTVLLRYTLHTIKFMF